MHTDFHNLMRDATRLTGAGDLLGATAAIQAALRGTPAPGDDAAGAAAQDLRVIDVEARELPEPPLQRQAPSARPARPAPAGGEQFSAGRHGAGAAARDFKLFVPARTGDTQPALVVMLHGCTQNPDDFAAGTRMNELARTHGCLVLYPAQSRQANPQGCWNWFKHSHQVRGRGEAALLAAMTQKVMQQHGVDPARVYVAGLSAGGAMAAILGEAYPELYAAVGVHSGLAAGAARDLPSALAAMQSGSAAAPSRSPRRPTIVFHGDADHTVHPDNGVHVVAASSSGARAAEVQRERAAAGRQYTRSTHRDPQGRVLAEHWVVHGSAHAWSGGSGAGSYTDPRGPDASAEMLRFFLEHPHAAPGAGAA